MFVKKERTMMIVTVGFDLGGTLCSMDAEGAVVLRRRVRRWAWVSLLELKAGA